MLRERSDSSTRFEAFTQESLTSRTDKGHMKTINALSILLTMLTVPVQSQEPDGLSYRIERTVSQNGFDGKTCWVHARAGAIPADQPGNETDQPLVVMTMQKLLLSGSDVFYALNEIRSTDLGKSWTMPEPHDSFVRVTLTTDTSEILRKRTGPIESWR